MIDVKEIPNIIKNLGDGVYKIKVKNNKIIFITHEKKLVATKKNS